MSFTSLGHFITFSASLEVAGRWIGERKVYFTLCFFLLECKVLLLLLRLLRFREFTNACASDALGVSQTIPFKFQFGVHTPKYMTYT